MPNKLQSEMNVVPYIDVTLVLLIIFMITTPLMTSKTQVEIPEYNNKKITAEDKNKHLFINFGENESLFLNDKNISKEELFNEIKKNPDKEIFIIADKKVIYGNLLIIMNDIKTNTERSNINLVTKNINK
tara:strand:+ start:31466 stop:31855 length:390 start_codon:yes stop_codon:yes gene_type:complete